MHTLNLTVLAWSSLSNIPKMMVHISFLSLGLFNYIPYTLRPVTPANPSAYLKLHTPPFTLVWRAVVRGRASHFAPYTCLLSLSTSLIPSPLLCLLPFTHITFLPPLHHPPPPFASFTLSSLHLLWNTLPSPLPFPVATNLYPPPTPSPPPLSLKKKSLSWVNLPCSFFLFFIFILLAAPWSPPPLANEAAQNGSICHDQTSS